MAIDEMVGVYLTIQEENCDLITAGEVFMPQNYIVGVDRSSANAQIDTINYWVAHMRQSGWLATLEKTYFVNANKCPEERGGGGDDITITPASMSGIFLLLLFAMLVAVALKLVERASHHAFLRLIWSRVDEDGSGSLDQKEVASLLSRMGVDSCMPKDELEAHLINMASHDKDGE